PDYAIRTRLLGSGLLHCDDVDFSVCTMLRAKPVIDADHLPEAAFAFMQNDHVRQEECERLPSGDVARAPNRVAETERLLLAGEARGAGHRQMLFQLPQLRLLVPAPQHFLQLELAVEVILDHALIAPSYKNKML